MLALPDPPRSTNGCSLVYLQIDVPCYFRDAVVRHHQHLVSLASNLQAALVLTDDVMRLLNEAVENYRTELAANIMAPWEAKNE